MPDGSDYAFDPTVFTTHPDVLHRFHELTAMTPEERVAVWDGNSDRPMNDEERHAHLAIGETDEMILVLALYDVLNRQRQQRGMPPAGLWRRGE